MQYFVSVLQTVPGVEKVAL